MPEDLQQKQREFRAALARLESRPVYRLLGWAVSGAVLAGQAALMGLSLQRPVGWPAGLLLLAAAWLLADLLGGLVHLIMDHHQRYTGFFGPLTAAFHLHHRTPRYQDQPLWRVYVHESGFKLWLPPFLALGLALADPLGPAGLRLWAWVGLLSSVAEVSHYLCHNSGARWARSLAAAGLLLPRREHARHHREDNVSYAFLNGWSNPLLDILARRGFPGYKQGTDRHFQPDEAEGGSRDAFHP
ncbi:MAG: fatty acid desaturase CarF family protein [Candidatus Delongbacteria bacterium]